MTYKLSIHVTATEDMGAGGGEKESKILIYLYILLFATCLFVNKIVGMLKATLPCLQRV